MKFEPLPGGPAQVGESPCWNPTESALYWVDIWGKSVHRWRGGEERVFHFDEEVAAVFPARSGGMLVVLARSLALLDPATGKSRPFGQPPPVPDTHRMNDAVIDPAGRLIGGTMRLSHLGAEPTGVLLSFDGVAWRRLLDGFYTLNGLAFAPDGRVLYLSDSHPQSQQIWTTPYAAETGRMGERRGFADMRARAGRPDGGTVDAEGCYWSAGVGGGELYRFMADGRLERTIAVPVEHPTKIAFGGEGLMTAYLTSLGIKLTRPDPQGLAGRVLGFDPGVAGLLVTPFAD